MKYLPVVFIVFIVFTFFSPVALANCTVQGFKQYYNDDKEIDGSPAPAGILNALVSTSGSVSSNANPYFLQNLLDGNYTISVNVPVGYDVGYTLCYNNTSCHSSAPLRSSEVNISCNGGFVDLYWHFRKLGDIDNNKIVNLQDLLEALRLIFP